jgi:maleate isomerase
MYGWRGRIGFLIAAMNRVVEFEAPQLAPDGVACHYARLPYTEISQKGISDMLGALETTTPLLAGASFSAGASAIGFAHATASSTSPEAAAQVVDRISRAGNVPSTTTLTAVVEGLRCLGAKRVSAALPYDKPERTLQLRSFLEGNGLKVEKIHTGRIAATKDGHTVSGQPPSAAHALIRDADAPGSDAVIMTIPNMRTIEVLNSLEEDLRKPVITGNQALMWHLLKLLGLKGGRKGFGELLTGTA